MTEDHAVDTAARPADTVDIAEDAHGTADAVPAEPSESPSRAEDALADRKMPREQRYRMELRAAEAERDQLRERVEAFQRREAERLAGDLAQPGDLFELGGVSLTDLLTEAGDVDSAAVAEAVATLISSRPLLARNPRVPAYDNTQGLGGHGGPPQPSFSSLFRSYDGAHRK
ncbi:hypothetical protein, partial [Mycobacterium paraintracellulare]|uniref:hypothetical protein n=1 Tax=Mycobacterium paraintracellulare TaxID=1138383 RepID=UPI001F3C2474